MKTNFVKITTASLLLGIAMLLNTNNASAQQVTEPVAQLNQPCEPHYRSHPQNKQRGEQQKNVEAQRIAFITQALNLTPDEAKVFWPVYNEYDAKRHDLKKSVKGAEKLHKEEIVKLTEKEASQLLDNQLIEAQKLLDLRKEYNGKFKAVLPSVKVLQLYDAEREFQKILMEKIRQHKQGKAPAGKE
jgi:hypothetical protein